MLHIFCTNILLTKFQEAGIFFPMEIESFFLFLQLHFCKNAVLSKTLIHFKKKFSICNALTEHSLIHLCGQLRIKLLSSERNFVVRFSSPLCFFISLLVTQNLLSIREAILRKKVNKKAFVSQASVTEKGRVTFISLTSSYLLPPFLFFLFRFFLFF